MKRTLFLFAGLFLLGIGLSGCGQTQDVAGQDAAGSTVVESPEKQELILAGIDLRIKISLGNMSPGEYRQSLGLAV